MSETASSERGRALRLPLLCVISGLLTALAFSTHSTGWLIWVSLTPWLYALCRHPQTVGSAARLSWIFGLGFYMGVIHWLKELHPLTWLPGVTDAISLLIVYGGIVFIGLVVSLWTLAWGALWGWLKPTGWRQVVYAAALWMLMEYGQALGEVSLPWARLAVSQYKNIWLLQLVPHTGQLVISGLIVAFNAALVGFVIQFAPERKPKAYWHYPAFRSLAAVSLAVLATLGYGWQRLQGAPPVSPDPFAERTPGQLVTVVQGNIPQGQKWNSSEDYWKRMQEIGDIYLNLSATAMAKAQQQGTASTALNPGLIVWPESAVPVFPRHATAFAQQYQQLSRSANSYLITGAFDQVQPPNDPIYNAAVLVEPSGEMRQWYYKRQLVPFGEFFPYRALLENVPLLGALVKQLNPMNSDTARGTEAGLFDTELGKIGTLICFESVYPQVARDSVRAGARIIAIVTNDGWYRDAIALYQHLGHAVLRALENERYVVRAGNTGVSGFIDSYGRILNQSVPLQSTYLSRWVSNTELPTRLTLYTRWGDWPIWLALLVLGLGEALRKRGQQTSQGTETNGTPA
ncbi:MAG: apolipoprotein N-acyltransferase [Candidatus Sericytochromatia bacterium]